MNDRTRSNPLEVVQRDRKWFVNDTRYPPENLTGPFPSKSQAQDWIDQLETSK